MKGKKKKETPIVIAAPTDYGGTVEKPCFKCKRKVYPLKETIAEVAATFAGKPKFYCPPCGKEYYRTNPSEKIGALKAASDGLGVPAELLELMGRAYLQSEPDAVAG